MLQLDDRGAARARYDRDGAYGLLFFCLVSVVSSRSREATSGRATRAPMSFTNDFGEMTFSADGGQRWLQKTPRFAETGLPKVDARDLAGTWFGCCCCPFVPFWPLSHVFCTTKKALNEDQYEAKGLCCFLCLPIPVSGTRTRKYVNGHPTNGFDGYAWDGKPNVPGRDPGCAAATMYCEEGARMVRQV